MITGRFAPSPTGPLHRGSLVAAIGSWLHARRQQGRWLVRMEDLDAPRVVPGSDHEILAALELYGLKWDGEVVYQSTRLNLYAEALRALRDRDLVFDCACSRADLARAASAPAASDPQEPAYPGTCRHGLPPGKVARAIRFRGADDFVVKRADGVFAYQLAVVVDDAAQAITQVVRGADLLSSTPRQLALQKALGYPHPDYVHLPLVTNPDGSKLGKRDGALPLPTLDEPRVRETLHWALTFLGFQVQMDAPRQMLASALKAQAALK